MAKLADQIQVDSSDPEVDFDFDSAIEGLVTSRSYFDGFVQQLNLMQDPEKKAKFMETLLGYRLSKLKTQDPIPETRYRPIEIRYTVAEKQTTVNNGKAQEDA